MSAAAASLQDIARAIRALEQEFQDHANAGNAAALTEAFYAADATLLPPSAPPVKGADAIRDFWAAFLGAGVTDAELRTEDVSASGDLAYNTGAYAFSLNGSRHTGKYLVVYRRQADGSYRAVADSFSGNA